VLVTTALAPASSHPKLAPALPMPCGRILPTACLSSRCCTFDASVTKRHTCTCASRHQTSHLHTCVTKNRISHEFAQIPTQPMTIKNTHGTRSTPAHITPALPVATTQRHCVSREARATACFPCLSSRISQNVSAMFIPQFISYGTCRSDLTFEKIFSERPANCNLRSNLLQLRSVWTVEWQLK